MNKVIITADSGLDPIDETHMIPCQINDNKHGYRDNHIEINNEKILNDARNGIYYKTSAPLREDYEAMFINNLENGYDIVHLAMSGKVSSSCVSQANIVASELNEKYGERIKVIDSITGATGGTLLYEIASDLEKQGLTQEEIVNYLNEVKNNIKTNFFVPNPIGFIRSGRNSHTLNMAEKAIKMLKLKFRVDFDEQGALGKKDIFKGFNNQVFYKMLNMVLDENIDNMDMSRLVIGSVKERDILMSDVIENLSALDANVINKEINGCVAAYGSEDLVGFSYILKK